MPDWLTILHALDPSVVALVVMTCIVCGVVWSWHSNKSTSFELQQVLVDSVSGKISIEKVGHMTALAVGTWGFVAMTLKGQMTEWYFTIYLSVFTLSRVASSGLSVFKDIKTASPPP